MGIAEKKLSLIERLMRVRRQGTLNQVEDILVQAEMDARTEESLEAIENNEVISFHQFQQNNQSWFEKKATK